MTVAEKPGETSRLVTVYTPESALRAPKRLVASMWRDLVASRELAWRLTIRDISARYRLAAFGILWAFLPPLATTATFLILNRATLIQVDPTDIPYPAFLLFGTVLWQLFTDSLNAPLKVIESNKSMLTKVNFPREALILSSMAQVLFDFAVRALMLAGVFIFFGLPISSGLVVLPFAIVMIMLLGIMLGMLVAPLGVLYSDVTSALPMLTSLWFFATPVIYPPPNGGKYELLMYLNPVAPLLSGARELATEGTIGYPGSFLAVSGLTIVGLVATWFVYRLSMPIVAERISA